MWKIPYLESKPSIILAKCFTFLQLHSRKNVKYLASIIDSLVITWDEITDTDTEARSYDGETETILKNIICETKSFIFYLPFFNYNCIFYSCIYYCLIKYKAKQKHLLPFYVTNNELKEVLY